MHYSLVVYCHRIAAYRESEIAMLEKPDVPDESLALRYFLDQFLPDNVVAIAYRTDQLLGAS